MAESGWLTRSLEQPYPYTLDYGGHISDPIVKVSFLRIIDFVQQNPSSARNILRILLNNVIQIRNKSQVKIIPLKNPDSLTIKKVIYILEKHFSYNYGTVGGAKLPVLAFYSIYNILINELKRFEGCHLAPLGSHLASDRSSKTSGDIQILKDKEIFEAIEVKLDRPINKTVVRIAIEKIITYNPKRYYIFSSKGVLLSDKTEINSIINDIRIQHGCQIIINGVIPSLKYYLRLISSLEAFISIYSDLISSDHELKKIHKTKWNELLSTTDSC